MYNIKNKTYDMSIWNAIESLINSSIDLRSKNLVVRVDLRYPQNIQYPNDNQKLSRFLDSFKHYCDRRGLDLIYFWVREESLHSDMATHHYHIFFLFNGREIQNPYVVLEKATHLWGRALGCDASGLVHYCKHKNPDHPNPYAIQIRRTSPNFEEVKDDVSKWVQYLAKRHSKEKYLGRTRPFAHSLI
ncbi:inovirus-type Gp2 protein [uncultured Pseudodesulfovibrio sp.]|uniref:YagK/YfjJ domain-containing protein n=1 Tax=uncultured Pseudodesulfovibrio sp. TaxID=2035858 RepID=UPI0029C8977D|nr:inovirus-type Gp2 protein [uncultured Pseudodesulfovibrio sp.]